MIYVDFTSLDTVPAGLKALADPFSTFSVIELAFKNWNAGSPIFPPDLGTGLTDK
jgi:hypothetical protein